MSVTLRKSTTYADAMTDGLVSTSHLSAWLLARREEAKLTRRAVSDALGVTERAIQRWEDDSDTPLPPADKFLAMVRLYNATPALVKLLGRWEKAARSAADGAGQGGARHAG